MVLLSTEEHIDDMPSHTWVGSDSRAKLAALLIQIAAGIQPAQGSTVDPSSEGYTVDPFEDRRDPNGTSQGAVA
jgi:hypothetical protein